jgi:hypothetical protein
MQEVQVAVEEKVVHHHRTLVRTTKRVVTSKDVDTQKVVLCWKLKVVRQ